MVAVITHNFQSGIPCGCIKWLFWNFLRIHFRWGIFFKSSLVRPNNYYTFWVAAFAAVNNFAHRNLFLSIYFSQNLVTIVVPDSAGIEKHNFFFDYFLNIDVSEITQWYIKSIRGTACTSTSTSTARVLSLRNTYRAGRTQSSFFCENLMFF